MKLRSAIIGVLGAALISANAHASTVIDSITGTHILDGDGASDQITIAAQSFFYNYSTTPDFGIVANLLLQNMDAQSTGSVMVYLVADNGLGGGNGIAGNLTYGTSGSTFTGLTNSVLLGSISDTAIGTTPSLQSVYASASTLAALASSNNEYWLVVSFDNDVTGGNSTSKWLYNDATPAGTGTDGQAIFNDYGGIYDGSLPVGPDIGPYDISIDAPEPATLAVLGGAIASLGLVRRRRRMNKKA